MAEACEIPSPTDSQALLRFTSTYVLNGGYSGTVEFANNNCQYQLACSGLCQPVSVVLDTSVAYPCCEEVPSGYAACFDLAATTKWVNGVMTASQEKTEPVSEIAGTVSSFFNHLGNKAISTQQFNIVQVATVIDLIADYYAGIPNTIRSFNPVNNFIKGPVEGSSTYEELRLLAQAGYSHLFVQVGGVLTISPWKGSNDPTELYISREWIISAEKADRTPARTSLIRFRGAELTKYDCGLKPFTDMRNTLNSGGYASRPGYFSMCQTSGIPTPTMKVSLDNLAANESDIKNGIWSSETTQVQEVERIQDGAIAVKVTKQDGTWFSDTPTSGKILLYGQHKDEETERAKTTDPRSKSNRDKTSNVVFSTFQSFVNKGFPPTYSSFGGPAQDQTSTDYEPDQGSPTQIDVVAQTDFISDCGVTQEDHENKYVFFREHLFNLALRRFQELKMEQNAWNLEVAYLPCLRLNQVIEFEVPETDECGLRVIKGIVAAITLEYDSDGPRAVQKVVVWDTSCLGDTTYVSGNLFDTHCAGDGNSSVIPALVSALDLDGGAGLENDIGWLYSTVGGTDSYFTLNKVGMDVGGAYTVSFDYDMEEGMNVLEFTYPGGSPTLSGTGSASYTFFATLANDSFTWNLPGGANASYRISNIKLTKTVVA